MQMVNHPQINKISVTLAKKREGQSIEERLIKEGEKKKKRLEELDKKDQAAAQAKLRKVDDKFILQKFNREFDAVTEQVHQEAMEQLEDPVNDTVPNDKLNYERFKNFLAEMCLLTEGEASGENAENHLIFDLWEIVAPKVDKELAMSVSDAEQNTEMEDEYMEKVKQGEVKINDVKTIVMGILRYNDGKRFVDATDAPLPASEGEIGFRRPNEPAGRFMLRYEELPNLRSRFEPLYLTRL